MSAIGHYMEEEGVPTTGISLVREHSEVMQPPRALWVPFPLGRPLGAPGNAVFQRRVLTAALRLFDEPSGPVLRDFPHDAPASEDSEDEAGEACPVNFGRLRATREGEHELAPALEEEIAQLRPWHDLAAKARGGTTVGLSGLTVEEAAAFIVSFLGASPPASYDPGLSLGDALKLACDDLRAFYEEAAAAQPGRLSARAVERWFYLETVAGEVLRALRRTCLSSDDSQVRFVADKVLIPRTVLGER